MDPLFPDLDQNIPAGMPILEEYVESHRTVQPLRGATALLIQHQLGNHVPQAKALLDLGISPKDLHWIDIPYTANGVVREAIMALGIPPGNFDVHNYRLLSPYAPYQRDRVLRVVKKFHKKRPKGKLLVLDDGAYYFEAAACFRERIHDVAVVEQTTRGLIKMEKYASLRRVASEVPVVNVARSTPKNTLEPPYIGRSVCAALKSKLDDKLILDPDDRCLVFGYGTIGKQVARFLRHLGFDRNRIEIYDPKKTRKAEAIAAGYSWWNRKNLTPRFRLVVGCSGRQSFTIGDYVYLKEEGDVFLASASSGSVELSRQDFIDLADFSRYDDIWVDRTNLNEKQVHSDIWIKLPNRNVVFLNGGFPVNFDGRINCVPARYIQPTPTMMVAAAVQAISEKKGGLRPLKPRFCNWVTDAFHSFLKKEGEEILPEISE